MHLYSLAVACVAIAPQPRAQCLPLLTSSLGPLLPMLYKMGLLAYTFLGFSTFSGALLQLVHTVTDCIPPPASCRALCAPLAAPFPSRLLPS